MVLLAHRGSGRGRRGLRPAFAIWARLAVLLILLTGLQRRPWAICEPGRNKAGYGRRVSLGAASATLWVLIAQVPRCARRLGVAMTGLGIHLGGI